MFNSLIFFIVIIDWPRYLNIMAAFRGMHLSPAKHSYALLPDRQTPTGQTDARQSYPYVPLCFAGDTKIIIIPPILNLSSPLTKHVSGPVEQTSVCWLTPAYWQNVSPLLSVFSPVSLLIRLSFLVIACQFYSVVPFSHHQSFAEVPFFLPNTL